MGAALEVRARLYGWKHSYDLYIEMHLILQDSVFCILEATVQGLFF